MNEANRSNNKSREWKFRKSGQGEAQHKKTQRYNFALVKDMAVRITKLPLQHKLWNERYYMLDKLWADRCHV